MSDYIELADILDGLFNSYLEKHHALGKVELQQELWDNKALIIAALRKAGAPAQTPPILWCCHVRGPDDVYAAPDYDTALAWADILNRLNWRDSGFGNTPKPSAFKDPTSYADCLVKAVPAIWPHSPKSHAEDLPKSIVGFADPASLSSTDGK